MRPVAGPPSALPDPEAPRVEVWREPDGRVAALADCRGAVHRLHLPGVATFEFEVGGCEVRVRRDPRASPATVVDQIFRTAVPLVLQARGSEVLHASAVRTAAGVVALCATKESGKSTLACALATRGHELWADDAVIFEIGEHGTAETIAVPFRLRLRPASAAHFGRPAAADPLAEVPAAWTGERAPLAAAFVLTRRRNPEPIELERLQSGAALAALLTHGYSHSLGDPERKEKMLRRYLALAAAVPVYELRYPDGLVHLDAMVARVEEVVAQRAVRRP